MRTAQFVVSAKRRAVREIRGPSLRKAVSAVSRNRRSLALSPPGGTRPSVSLSPPGGGEGRGEVGESRAVAEAHLTLPLRGPLPLPPEGRRGVLATRNDRDARLSEAISVQSLWCPPDRIYSRHGYGPVRLSGNALAGAYLLLRHPGFHRTRPGTYGHCHSQVGVCSWLPGSRAAPKPRNDAHLRIS